MPEILSVVTLAVSSGTLITALTMAFKAGALVQRLEEVEKKVRDIDMYGCRHRRTAEDASECLGSE